MKCARQRYLELEDEAMRSLCIFRQTCWAIKPCCLSWCGGTPLSGVGLSLSEAAMGLLLPSRMAAFAILSPSFPCNIICCILPDITKKCSGISYLHLCMNYCIKPMLPFLDTLSLVSLIVCRALHCGGKMST